MEKDFAALREIDGDLFKSLFHRARLGLFLLYFHSISYLFISRSEAEFISIVFPPYFNLISPSQFHSPVPISRGSRLVESTRKGIQVVA